MKNPQAARRIVRGLIRMGKAPLFIIQYLISRRGASQEEAEAMLKWAEKKEEKR